VFHRTGRDGLARPATEKFKVALQQEEEHLERVRSWVEEMTMAQASRK
jgi:hypothetical protein